MKKLTFLLGLCGALFAANMVMAANDAPTGQLPPPPDSVDDQPVPQPDDGPPPIAPAPDQTTAPAALVPAPAPTAPPAAALPTPPTITTPAVSTPSLSSAPDTNVIAPIPPGVRALRLNFRNAPLDSVLHYMSAAAGFIINSRTDVSGKVTVFSDQPLTSDEAVSMLKTVLGDNGYAIFQDGKTLTIIRKSDATRSASVPVKVGTDPDQIPSTPEIVTQVLPLHSLNAVQVVKDLDQLRPSDTTMTANDSANSLVMTGTQASIHHFAEILKGLDSVNSSAATVKVYPLKFADAKSIATLITTLFPSSDNAQGGRGGGFGFGRFNRGGGGFNPFGGGGGNDSNPAESGHTPTAKVEAVSDDHSNSLVVSVPDSLIETIDGLVAQVDTPVEDTTEMRVFSLKNADPTEMANLITSLYPDDTGSTDATRSGPSRFGFGFPFGGGFGGNRGGSSAESPSDRMKKMAHVSAVADERTSSLVVTAGTNVLDQIAQIVMNLDSRNDRKMSVHLIPLANAEPIDVMGVLQDIYPATSMGGTSSRNSSSLNSSTSNPLQNRATTLLQQENNSQATTSSFGSGSTGSSSGRGF